MADRPARLDTVIRVLGVLCGLAMAVLVLSLAGWITGQPLSSQLLTAPPPSGPEQPAEQPHENLTPTQQLSPPVSDRPVPKTPKESPARLSPARPANESPSREGPATANSVSPRTLTAEARAPAKAGTDESANSGRPRFNATQPSPKPSVPVSYTHLTLPTIYSV